ncbi:MAG: hypothetical protein JWM92_333 [Candidatus Nomurabacteria bacterium]|jgi:hypothetical protein|nr:hypothetical protein [Candidatus Nomurabacteria bacterium]
MIRTIIGIAVLFCAILWLPLWLQLVVYALVIILIPHRVIVLVPAIVSDALYAPTTHFSLYSHWLTLSVLVMLGIHWFVVRKMRVNTPFYGLEA